MDARKARSSGRLLTSLIVAAIIPMMLLGASAAYFIAEAGRTTARRDAARTVAGVADRVAAALVKEVELAEALASQPSLDRPDLERFYRTAQRIAPQRSLWKTVSLADTSGMQRMNILRRLGDDIGPVTDRESFDRALRERRTAIGGVGPLGPVSGQRLVSISTPIIRNNEISLVLVIGLSPVEIQNILANAGAPKDWIGVIVDGQGRVVARSTGVEDIGRPASEPVQRAIAGEPQGEYRGRMRSGVEVDTLYQRLPGDSGWSVHFGVPSARLDGPVARSLALLVASCAVCLLLAGGLAKVTARDLEQRRREQDDYSDMVLALSEERAAVAIKAAELGTWKADTSAGVISGSGRTRDLLNLAGGDNVPAPVSMSEFFRSVHPKERAALMQAIRDCSGSERSLDMEFRALRSDGSYRWLRAAGRRATADERRAIGDDHQSGVVHGVLADIDSAKRAAAERMRLTRRLTEAQDNEQRRIALELHDHVGQSLTGLALGLKRLEQDLDASGAQTLRERVQWLESITSDISRDIHSVAADLRPTALDDLGLSRALSALAAEIGMRHEVSIEVQTIGTVRRLPPDIEIAVYRIVQEALTNVLKHACAQTVSVIIDDRGDGLHVVVEDDGRGFNPDVLAERASEDGEVRNRLGLASIRERLTLINGSLRIESRTGAGSTLFIDVPLAAEKLTS